MCTFSEVLSHMRALSVLFAALVFSGCSANAPPGTDTQVLVNVIDGAGHPFRPDRVVWYYPPDDQGRAEEHAALCAGQDCTSWIVTGATRGPRLYVAAWYRREHPSASCDYSGFDAMPVEVLEGSVPEVTLQLIELESCE